MKLTKRITAMLLCVALLLSVTPMVWAVETDETALAATAQSINGEGESLTLSSMTKVAESSALQTKTPACNEILPHLSMENLTIERGSFRYLLFSLWSYGYVGQYYYIMIFQGTEIDASRLVGYHRDYYPTEPGCYDLTLTLSTTELNSGIYTVYMATFDAYDEIVGEVNSFPVRLVDWAKPMTDLCFMDLDTYAPTSSLSIAVGGQATVYVNQMPSDHTAERVYALYNTDPEVARVVDYGGLICIDGLSDGLTTLGCQINGLEVAIPITVGTGVPKPVCAFGDSCAMGRFTDMPPVDNWAHEGIDYVVYNGLFNGATETTFEPETPMTRGMLVTVLYRLSGSPAVTSANPFTDVRNDYYYTAPIIWATENGIVNGVGKGLFEPEENVTREQLATILYRYAAWGGFDVSATVDVSGFPDAGSVNGWAQTAMSWAFASGIVTGSQEHGQIYLLPQDNATRAQVATMLMRFCREIMYK